MVRTANTEKEKGNATNTGVVVGERTSLLVSRNNSSSVDNEDDDDDDYGFWEEIDDHNPKHRLSSNVIRRTSVLFRITTIIEEEEEEGDEDESISEELQLQQQQQQPESFSSSKNNIITLSSVLNLVVATAGGIGMVTLPGSFAQVGWFEGILLLVVSGIVAAFSLVLLHVATSTFGDNDPSKTSSYAGLVAHVLGHFGSQTLEALTLLYCIGQVIAYLGAIGGQISLMFGLSIHQSIAGISFLAMFPFSLLPEQGAMRFAGALGTACMVYIVSVVVFSDGISAMQNGICSLAATGTEDDDDVGPVSFSPSLVVMLKNAPIFLFSVNASVTYVPVRYHHKKSLIYSNSSRRSSSSVTSSSVGNNNSHNARRKQQKQIQQRESSKLIIESVVIALLFYLSCSGAAYLAYCSSVPENVVDAWSLSWFPGLLARVLLSIELTVAAAGIYIPLGRAAFWHLLRGPYETIGPKGWVRTIISLSIIVCGAIGSIALDGALALPLAVTSALCVTTQMFILPGLCIYKLSPPSSSYSPVGTSTGGRRNTKIPGGAFTGLSFALFGTLFGVLSLAALFNLL